MKKIFIFIIIVALFGSLIGCSSNTLEDYKEAVIRTENITKGKSSFKINIINSFNYEGLPEDTVKDLAYFENIEISSVTTFDFTKLLMHSMSYFNFGGLGYDSDVYLKDNEVIVRIPIIGKYIVINNNESQEIDSQANSQQFNDIYVNIIMPIQNKSTEILERENVVKGEKSIMSTEDGDVKATKYTIKLNDEQIEEFINFLFDIIVNNKEYIDDFSNLAIDKDSEMNFEELLNLLKKELDDFETITFEKIAYIDIDGYIVKDTVTIEFFNENAEPGKVSYRKFILEEQNWNNEIEQKIEIPTINPEDIIDINDSEGSFMFFLNN